METFSIKKDADISDIINDMRSFNNQNEDPFVGIFWYDSKNNELFGIQSISVNQIPFDNNGKKTFRKTHKDYWKRESYRPSRDKRIHGDYTMTPRGRVYQLKDNTFKVYVGDWINEYRDKVTDLIKEEFNIDKFEFIIDEHCGI
jgi:hypothetical protein